MALSSGTNFGLAGEGYGGFGSMLSGAMVPPRLSLPAQLQGRNVFTSPGLSLAPVIIFHLLFKHSLSLETKIIVNPRKQHLF